MQPADTSTQRIPPAWLLITLNAGIFLGFTLLSARWPLGYILAAISTAVFVVVSGVWHGLVLLFERRYRLIPPLRVFVFLLPVIALIALPYLGIRPPQKINQQHPAVSSTGSYKAFVSAPGDYWVVRITGNNGSNFQENTDFVGHLNIYWAWDVHDRLWIYNSDDGAIHFWQQDAASWKHVEWGSRRANKTSVDDQPPDALFPDYAKNPR